ncbi:hypothetical protein [uncultured Shewanella sp.]|uniref:hypothetical protein n=1 Tax=uncultured Shewanella sp. TaxID=173975 RepID=UPI002637E541|nr:hypothetical protein [uncultured Shewanella sp.]
MEFNILKKNRKYFAAIQNGYKCKILIDDKSENLELGHVDIEVDDISVRSKYGTDLIYKLTVDADEQKAAGICTLKHYTYNKILVKQCHELGGKWDSEEQAWIFKDFVADKVEEMDYLFNSDLKNYELFFQDGASKSTDAIYIFGIKIAEARGRDSGATIGDDIAFIQGGCDSGGSMKNWKTIIKDGSAIRLNIPCLLVEKYLEEEKETWDFELKEL